MAINRFHPEPASNIGTNDDVKLIIMQMIRYNESQFQRISQMLTQIADGRRDVLHAPPGKADEGMIVNADGVDWNPGAGAGLYIFRGVSWHKIF